MGSRRGGALVASGLLVLTAACGEGPPPQERATAVTAATTTTAAEPTTTSTPSATTSSTTAPPGEGLVLAASPDLALTFDSAAGVTLGQVVAGFEPPIGGIEPGGCGGKSVTDQVSLWGSFTGDGDRATVFEIKVADPRYRTASGVGVGTSLAELRRVYGDRLVFDDMDGWDRPTNGLLASYAPVAAVREGARALTFVLESERVRSVEISSAEAWGDDEGCA